MNERETKKLKKERERERELIERKTMWEKS